MSNNAHNLTNAELRKGLDLWAQLVRTADFPSADENQARLLIAMQHRHSLNDVYWRMQTECTDDMRGKPLVKRFWHALTVAKEPSLMDVVQATIGLQYAEAIRHVDTIAPDINGGPAQKISVRKPLKLRVP